MYSFSDANGISNINYGGLPEQERRNDLEKEVLVALFNGDDRPQQSSRKASQAARRAKVLGELAVELPGDFTFEHKTVSVGSKQDKCNGIYFLELLSEASFTKYFI